MQDGDKGQRSLVFHLKKVYSVTNNTYSIKITVITANDKTGAYSSFHKRILTKGFVLPSNTQ